MAAKYVLKDGKLVKSEDIQQAPVQIPTVQQQILKPAPVQPQEQQQQGFEEMPPLRPQYQPPQQPQYQEQPIRQYQPEPQYQPPQQPRQLIALILLEGGLTVRAPITEDDVEKLDNSLIVAIEENRCLRLDGRVISGNKIVLYEFTDAINNGTE